MLPRTLPILVSKRGVDRKLEKHRRYMDIADKQRRDSSVITDDGITEEGGDNEGAASVAAATSTALWIDAAPDCLIVSLLPGKPMLLDGKSTYTWPSHPLPPSPFRVSHQFRKKARDA